MRVRRVITTRAGGVSRGAYESFNLGDAVGDEPGAVAANRKRLGDELGLGERLVWMEQVHGRNAVVVEGPREGAVPVTDAMVTGVAGLAVVAVVADCVPVLLADPEAGVVGVAHAGRVGARIGVVVAALEAMRGVGADVGRVEVLLGPEVCGECYEVPGEMQADVEKYLPGSACRTRAGTAGLDLRAGLWRQLADAGVARIGIDPRCTVEDRSLFSHRRDGTTGRLAALTWIDRDGDR